MRGREGAEIAAANQAEKRAERESLVAGAPDRMRELLAPHVDRYCERLIGDMDDPESSGHRAAMRLIPEILRAVGGQVMLTVNLWQRFGASDESHAQRLIASALEAENVDEDSAWRLSEQFAADYRRRHGLPELVEARRPGLAVEVESVPRSLLGDGTPSQGRVR